MSRIFETAVQVIAWLGSNEAVATFIKPDDEKKTPEGDLAFRSSTFWQRLWIQQELMLAKTLLFAACEWCVPSNRHIALYSRASNLWLPTALTVLVKRKRHGFPSVPFDHAAPIREDSSWSREAISPRVRFVEVDRTKVYKNTIGRNIRGAYRTTGKFSLLDAIRDFSENECADARDNVYGLLGMVQSDQTLNVEYTLSTHDVLFAALSQVLIHASFEDVTEHFVEMTFCDLAYNMDLDPKEYERIRDYIAERYDTSLVHRMGSGFAQRKHQ